MSRQLLDFLRGTLALVSNQIPSSNLPIYLLAGFAAAPFAYNYPLVSFAFMVTVILLAENKRAAIRSLEIATRSRSLVRPMTQMLYCFGYSLCFVVIALVTKSIAGTLRRLGSIKGGAAQLAFDTTYSEAINNYNLTTNEVYRLIEVLQVSYRAEKILTFEQQAMVQRSVKNMEIAVVGWKLTTKLENLIFYLGLGTLLREPPTINSILRMFTGLVGITAKATSGPASASLEIINQLSSVVDDARATIVSGIHYDTQQILLDIRKITLTATYDTDLINVLNQVRAIINAGLDEVKISPGISSANLIIKLDQIKALILTLDQTASVDNAINLSHTFESIERIANTMDSLLKPLPEGVSSSIHSITPLDPIGVPQMVVPKGESELDEIETEEHNPSDDEIYE